MHSHKLSGRKSKYRVKSIYNTKRKVSSIKSQFSFIQLNKDTPSTATGLANLILKEIFYIKKMLRSLKFNLYTYLINFSAAKEVIKIIHCHLIQLSFLLYSTIFLNLKSLNSYSLIFPLWVFLVRKVKFHICPDPFHTIGSV